MSIIIKKPPDKKSKNNFTSSYTVIKCKLDSVISDSSLKDIIIKNVHQRNKIFVEGILLFNIYVLYILENNICMKIGPNTLRRCMNYLVNKPGTLKKHDQESELMETVKKDLFDFSSNGRTDDFNNTGESFNRPFNMMCDIYHTNIRVHIMMNFKRFQKRYLLCRLNAYDMKDSERTKILYCLQQRINGNTEYDYKKAENKQIFDDLCEKHNLEQFIYNEQQILINYTSNKIILSHGDELKNEEVKDENIYHYLKYFHYMLPIIKGNNSKTYSILPQCSPKIRYVHYESISMVPIYNEWKQEDINVKIFEKNYKTYFNKMFVHVKEKFSKLMKKYPSISSFSTDGYSVAFRFEKKIKKGNNKNDNKNNKNYKINFKKMYEIDKTINNKEKIYDVEKLEKISEYDRYFDRFNIVGVDPGSSQMFDITGESGIHFTINKNHFNDLSHINRNKILRERIEKINNVDKINGDLSNGSTRTIDIKDYMKYVKQIRNNWTGLWNHYTNNRLKKLSFNTYRYSAKAVNRICDEIVKGVNDPKNLVKKYGDHHDIHKFEANKKKIILFCIGTGNGKMTIDNTKGSSPHGPIKRIVNRLSKHRKCIVMLIVEHNTSKLCHKCENELVDVHVIEKPKKKDQDKKIIKAIEQNRFNVRYYKTLQKSKTTEELIKEQNEEAKKNPYYKKSYRLRRCAHKHEGNNKRCILYERNVNASLNMMKKFKLIIAGETVNSRSKLFPQTIEGNKTKKKDNKKNDKAKDKFPAIVTDTDMTDKIPKVKKTKNKAEKFEHKIITVKKKQPISGSLTL